MIARTADRNQFFNTHRKRKINICIVFLRLRGRAIDMLATPIKQRKETIDNWIMK